MERWEKETGKPNLEFEVIHESQREQAICQLAQRNASPIVAMGFEPESALEKCSLGCSSTGISCHQYAGEIAERAYSVLGQSVVFSANMIVRRGYMVPAALTVGRWHSVQAFAACLLFGLLNAVAIPLQGIRQFVIGKCQCN